MFSKLILSMQKIEILGFNNIFVVKDLKHIYLMDLTNYDIYPIVKSDYDFDTANV
jgi:hypothetical protein